MINRKGKCVDMSNCILNWRFGAWHLQLTRQPLRLSLNFNDYHRRNGDGRAKPGWHWFEAY